MNILPVDKTETFTSRVLNTELVRTGTEGSGSCFFYALYYPFRHFRERSLQDRAAFIKKEREKLAHKIDQEQWFCIQNGNTAFLQTIGTMRNLIQAIPRFMKENQDYFQKYDIEPITSDILFSLLNPDVFENEILPQWDMECTTRRNDKVSFLEKIKKNWYDICQKNITKSIDRLEEKLESDVKKMDPATKKRVIQKLALLSHPILDYVCFKALEDFKHEIADSSKWVNIFIFFSILDYLEIKVNILILDAETGMPYEGMKLIHDKKRFLNDYPFVVLLYFKDSHFESLGKKIEQQNKVVIHRLFNKNDPFIITFLSYLEKDDYTETIFTEAPTHALPEIQAD